MEPTGNEVEAIGVEINHVDKRMLPAAYPTFCNVVRRHMME
ncbi:MAG TPA: hypothetical protein VEY13_05935 [Rubrobacteraceae bacterium]|nr:hypothetical protein [Rubrobacteraceae bacterium]